MLFCLQVGKNEAEDEDESAASSSCHVFMVEPTGSEHERIQRARVFNIPLTYTNQVEIDTVSTSYPSISITLMGGGGGACKNPSFEV